MTKLKIATSTTVAEYNRLVELTARTIKNLNRKADIAKRDKRWEKSNAFHMAAETVARTVFKAPAEAVLEEYKIMEKRKRRAEAYAKYCKK